MPFTNQADRLEASRTALLSNPSSPPHHPSPPLTTHMKTKQNVTVYELLGNIAALERAGGHDTTAQRLWRYALQLILSKQGEGKITYYGMGFPIGIEEKSECEKVTWIAIRLAEELACRKTGVGRGLHYDTVWLHATTPEDPVGNGAEMLSRDLVNGELEGILQHSLIGDVQVRRQCEDNPPKGRSVPLDPAVEARVREIIENHLENHL